MTGNGQVEAYRLHAGKCVQLAHKSIDAETKLVLLDMARAWLALVEQSVKNSQTTPVYETLPSRRPSVIPVVTGLWPDKKS